MKAQKGQIEVGRFSVPFRKYGRGENLILCVSGALQTMAVWSMFVRKFADDFTVVIYDMPGVGRSEILSGSHKVSIEDQAGVVHALVEEHRNPIGEVLLAGSSWGTAIAVLYASTHPDNVDKLLIGSFGMKPNPKMLELIGEAADVYNSGDWERGANVIIQEFGDGISATYKRMIVNQFTGLSNDQAESFYEHCTYIATVGELEDFVDLSRITARTCIINGSADTILDMADIHTAHARIPDCEIHIIDNVGHFLHFEKPELMELYEEFLHDGTIHSLTGDTAQQSPAA